MRKILGKHVLRVAVAGVVTLGGMEAWATPCKDFTDAINWANQTTANETYPVEAYFTRHSGFSGASDDFVIYSFGYVVGGALSILSGNLGTTFFNNNQGKMAAAAGWSIYVEIAYLGSGSNGQLTYQPKINGQPFLGSPKVTVKTTCVGDFLMTGVDGDSVVTVGVSLQPGVPNVVPK